MCSIVSPRCEAIDLDLCLTTGQVFRWEPLASGAWLGVDGDYWYELSALGGGLSFRGSGDEASLALFFRLEVDAEAVGAELSARGPEIEPDVSRLRGARLMRPSDPVEAFFTFLCTPHNHVRRITGMVRRLASYGPVLAQVEGRTLHRFPNVETIARIPEAELRAHGFGYRGATIPQAARAVFDRGGEAWLESLRREPYDRAMEALTSIPNVGPKLADCIALYALDSPYAAPVDTHVYSAVTRLYFPEWRGTALTGPKYRAIGDMLRARFGELTAWAQLHLYVGDLRRVGE